MQSETGNLRVAVFNTSVAIPIGNARVFILQNDEQGNQTTLAEVFTDVSGQTDLIQLPAPPFQYSLEPDQPRPYSEYNVYVESDGFEPALINGVQIFSQSTAIQEVYLLPIEESEQEEIINIPPPTLWGNYPTKIPESEEKELSPETGFVVLDEVVIPEYIVVHDGDPNDSSAPNYWVSYKDYIKNVASSEIYSTWPDAAIRANILAINSFTLNRVYTEWYRNMGKDFTITNSTRYDQFFVYGRNIFEEISVVVDEMFTNYIKRPGQRQPLFTQYCDGRSVSCPNWLSQWGSASLAEEGYSTIQILRYYYGNDIYLETASKVSGVPTSYPGYALELGSTGNSVRTIQEQLNSISNNYPAINKVVVDSVFGERTREAVITFQGIFNLPQSGIVDFPTWYEISEVFVAVEKLAEL